MTVSDLTGLAVGEPITGTGIASGTVISAINGTTNVITLSKNATASGTNSLAVTLLAPIVPVTLNASTTVTATNTAGLYIGEQVFAPGIPVGATIASITNGTTFVLSAAATVSLTGVNMMAVNASDAIEATQGNTLTLSSPFATGANSIIKLDNGTLAINAGVNNSTWLGQTIVSAGAVQVVNSTGTLVSNSSALGTSTTNGVDVLNFQGAALQLAGGTTGITISIPLNLSNTGINTGGALESVSGSNTESGAITLFNAATIGADTGSTLTLSGGITGGSPAQNPAQVLTFAGGGTINLTSTALGAVASVTKIGSGTVNVQVASTSFVGPITVNGGTFGLSGAGTVGGIPSGGAATITLNPGSTLAITDTTVAGNAVEQPAGQRDHAFARLPSSAAR